MRKMELDKSDESGIDELMITALSIKDVDDEQHRLQKSVGSL